MDHRMEEEPEAFVWIKTADEILATLATYCRRIQDSAHQTVSPRRLASSCYTCLCDFVLCMNRDT
jgi:hypothetical protein